MAETIKIEIYRQKNAEDFTAALADPDSRLETGSGAAATAAVAAAQEGEERSRGDRRTGGRWWWRWRSSVP